MADTMRDTPCAKCYKWLHILTPHGDGIIFCDEHCAWKYGQQYNTSYAFDVYHYIAVGARVMFETLDADRAWKSLAYWCSKVYYPKTVDQVKEQYNLTHTGSGFTTFTKIHW